MNSLIIENQWSVDEDLERYVRDHPDLVGELTTIVDALNESDAVIGQALSQADNLWLKSTFMYKNQVEELLEAIVKQQFGPRLKRIYVLHLMSKLHDWTQPAKISSNITVNGVPAGTGQLYSSMAGWGFNDHEKFLANLTGLVNGELIEVYDVTTDHRWFDSRTGEYVPRAERENFPREFIKWPEVDDAEEMLPRRVRFNAEARQFFHEGDELEPDAFRY